MNKQIDFEFEPVTIGSVRFRNPFFVASGPTTRNLKQLMRAEECGWGGASIKLTIAPEPYINREPRYGWFQNQGIFSFTTEKRLTPDQGLKLVEEARKNTSELVIMANITYAGEKNINEGWGELARQFESAGAHVIELNMCCPNMSFNTELSDKCCVTGPRTGASLGQDAEAVSMITKAVIESVSIPVFVKLTPEGGKIADVAQACFGIGAHAVGGTGNRMAIPPFDIYNPTASPYYLQKEISMSCFAGEFIKPLALRDVYEMRKTAGPGPIITGAGGLRNYQDIIQMTFMGANLFGICTETIISGFDIISGMINGIKTYFDETGYKSLDDIRGSVIDDLKSAKTVTLTKGYAKVKDRTLSAPCVTACPSYVPAQGYVMAAAKKDFRKAYNLITSSSPLQSVCAYACNHPCEEACIRGSLDEPVKIKEIKRFVLEYGRQQGWKPDLKTAKEKNSRIAVIGSGPAGLSAAFYLRLAGYNVTIFEKDKKAGGLLRYGIPRYRLPEETIDQEVQMIEQLGVEIKTSAAFPSDVNISQLKESGYDAVILAVGAGRSIALDIPDDIKSGYFTAVDFLREIQLGGHPEVGQKAVIVGGGFSAVDAARTCIREGAEKVYIVYRRTKDEMPASPEEIQEAEEEGVKIMYLTAPKAVLTKEGRITGMRLVNYVLGKEDTSGRRRPEEVEGTEFTLKADTIISALGQKIENLAGEEWEKITKNGSIAVDPETMMTNLPDVYAAGDAALGAGDIISAAASGKKVASSIDRKLSGDQSTLWPVKTLNPVERNHVLETKGNSQRKASLRNYTAEPSQRRENYNLYSRPFTEEEAAAEAGRCLNCGCGEGCMICADLCNSFAISNNGGKPDIDQDECVGCGICVWRCPNDNIEMIQL